MKFCDKMEALLTNDARSFGTLTKAEATAMLKAIWAAEALLEIYEHSDVDPHELALRWVALRSALADLERL